MNFYDFCTVFHFQLNFNSLLPSTFTIIKREKFTFIGHNHHYYISLCIKIYNFVYKNKIKSLLSQSIATCDTYLLTIKHFFCELIFNQKGNVKLISLSYFISAN